MIDLRKARTDHGLSQQELADKVGVIRQTISHIETGRMRPSVTTAQAIAEVLRLNWADFFTR